MNIKWITHSNKRILYSDYRGLNSEQMISQIKQEAEIILKAGSKILYLGNFEGTVVDSAFMKIANELGKKTQVLNEKSAVVGVSGMKTVMLNTYNLFTKGQLKAFSTEEKALEFLSQ
jgi:hypothetical protein